VQIGELAGLAVGATILLNVLIAGYVTTLSHIFQTYNSIGLIFVLNYYSL
jgi:hypothetical protein